jgi:hypothetical protein
MKQKVETLSFAEVLDLFFEAVEERDILRTENKNLRDELIDLEAQVGILIDKREKLRKIIDHTMKYLEKASVVSEIYWEYDKEPSWEQGVIALLTRCNDWAKDGAYEDTRKLLEDYRKSKDLPF